MSTVSATNLKNASSSVNNAVTTSGGDLTNAAGVSFMGGSKNLLYNGACQIAQRGTSAASITAGGYYTADRWAVEAATLGTWTQSVENDAPMGSGFRKSVKMLCTTADNSPAAGDLLIFTQSLEGQDLQRIAKGTASAQQLTLSFWVKTNVAGTYVIQLNDGDNSRQVGATYSIAAGDSGNWVKRTVTFPADTTGAFDNDNDNSLRVRFWLGAGSNFTSGTLRTSWATTTSADIAVGQTNLAASTNNYWQITGVQLEVGPVATSFEFEDFGTTLRKCQRYYWRVTTSGSIGVMQGWANGTTVCDSNIIFPQMRVAPTAIDSSNGQVYRPANAITYSGGTTTLMTASDSSAAVRYTHGSSVFTSAENLVFVLATGYFGLSAEL